MRGPSLKNADSNQSKTRHPTIQKLLHKGILQPSQTFESQTESQLS